MPFKSKAQIRKFGELVKQGKMKQSKMDEWLKETKSPHRLPDRVGAAKPVKNLAELNARAKARKK